MTDKQTTKFICTPAHPWRKGMPTPVVHPAGREIASSSGYPAGDIATFRCDVCRHEWEMEMAQ